jgi:hypothetical protein
MPTRAITCALLLGVGAGIPVDAEERKTTDTPFRWEPVPMGKPLVDLRDKDGLYRILDEGS